MTRTAVATLATGGIGPEAILGASEPVRAATVFLALVVFGGVALYRDEALVDRSIDASMAHPVKGTIYGVVLQVGLILAWGYLYAMLGGVLVGTAGTLLFLSVAVGSLLAVAGVGFTVVGSTIFAVVSYRQLWPGLVVGATIGALVALVPSPAVAAVLWIAIGSLGVGGSLRKWVHDDRVDIDRA